MRTALLIRDESSDHGTLGALAADGGPALHVMEPPWRGNARNRSRIPPGAYRVLPHVSPRFGRSALVARVPGRSHILVHAGNLGGDAALGLRTHTRGCLLPGTRRGWLAAGARRQRAVLASRTALRLLLAWMAGEPFELRVVDAVPLEDTHA